MAASSPFLPFRALASLVAGYSCVAGLALVIPHDPLARLPKDAPASAAAVPPGWEAPPAPGVTRVAVVGASETIGFPYGKDVSFAELARIGLAAVGEKIEVAPFGGTALDSPRIAALARRVLAAVKPTRMVVVLGGNEFSGRVFAGKSFLPDGLVPIAVDWLSRVRLLFGRPEQDSTLSPLATDNEAAQAELLSKVYAARPGRPALEGLPVGRRDRAALNERFRRTITALVADVRAAGCEIVLAIAPYDVLGSEPYGVTEAGSPAERADLDPAPMHKTSTVVATIRERAQALRVRVLDLDGALFHGAGPDPARFLDALHPDSLGQAQMAFLLAPALLGRELPASSEEAFRAAVEAHRSSRVDAARDRGARLQAGWSDVLLHLLCGNFAGALPPLRRNLTALEEAPADVQAQQVKDLGGYVLLTVFGLRGRIDQERPQVARHLEDLVRAIASKRSGAWLDAALR